MEQNHGTNYDFWWPAGQTLKRKERKKKGTSKKAEILVLFLIRTGLERNR
jgi:hypothetical protein